MEQLIEFLQGFNIQNILCFVAVIWYFTKDLKAELQSIHHDLNIMNTRISRLEGTVYGKEIYDTKI